MKCIPFNTSLDEKGILWRNDMRNYAKYILSHDWKTIITEDTGMGIGYLEKCTKCGVVMQHPSGTINFRFGCKMIKGDRIPIGGE